MAEIRILDVPKYEEWRHFGIPKYVLRRPNDAIISGRPKDVLIMTAK